jgi:hypothetical protein
MLTDYKIDKAIKSFSAACMNNVKWKNLCYKIAVLLNDDKTVLKIMAKPVWSESISRASFRIDQVSDSGIKDPGIFGNDREEYKQIEWLKVDIASSHEESLNMLVSWCNENRIEIDKSDKEFTIFGYKK